MSGPWSGVAVASPSTAGEDELPSTRSAGRDRRRRPTPMLSRYTFVGRRRRNRRRDDPRSRYYVDWVDGWFRYVLYAAILLIVFDTFSTLWIISHGGSEMNAFVARVLAEGTGWYIALKLLPLALMVPIIAATRAFPLVRMGTILLTGSYVVVFLRHLLVWLRM